MRGRLIPLLIATVAVAGCGSDAKDSDTAKATATPSATVSESAAAAAPTTGCRKVGQPRAKQVKLAKPTERLDATKTYTAVVSTSCGSFSIRLDVKRAPKTTASFAYQARKRLFDRLTFHRISPGFVIQGGDPKGNGTGGPGYTTVEAPPSNVQYTRGTVAMAKGPDEPAGAAGSQFFVVTADSPLPADYALLGRVTSGLDVVDTIATTPSDPSTEQPLSPVVINSVRIKTS